MILKYFSYFFSQKIGFGISCKLALSKFLSFRVYQFQNEAESLGKQTGSHKSCLPREIMVENLPSVSSPLKKGFIQKDFFFSARVVSFDKGGNNIQHRLFFLLILNGYTSKENNSNRNIGLPFQWRFLLKECICSLWEQTLPFQNFNHYGRQQPVFTSWKHTYIILTPLNPQFYIVKLGLTGVYIIFLISAIKT